MIFVILFFGIVSSIGFAGVGMYLCFIDGNYLLGLLSFVVSYIFLSATNKELERY